MDERHKRTTHRQVLEPDGLGGVGGFDRAHARAALTSADAYRLQRLQPRPFDRASVSCGATVYDRSHHPEELFSTLAQTDLFDFDTVILPARAKRGKGAGLADLLEDDPNLLARHGVRWWVGSSGTFDEHTVQLARAQGVESISNLYGSSEFGIFAMSCAKIPGDFHVSQGHVLVEVVDESGNPVQNGDRGRIVVTHLCGMEEDGHARPHAGTQVLRLAIGDAGTLLTDTCECGLTAPRLRDIQRVPVAA